MAKQNEIRTRIEDWNPERGYGFAHVDGRRVFIHVSSIHPQPGWGADLTGREITIGWISEEKKGPRAGDVYLHESVLDSFARGLGDLMKSLRLR